MKIFEETIKSRNNPTVKWASSLLSKKGRYENGVFIAEGDKLSFEAMSEGLDVTCVFIREDRWNELIYKVKESLSDIKFKDTCVYRLENSVFEKISSEKAPQGIITVIKHLDFFYNIDIINKENFSIAPSERVLMLSSVRDPGNLGSVIRSAVAFGVDHIILSDDCAELYNPKTVRSAMGSLFRVKTTVCSDISGLFSSLREQNRRIFAAELRDGAVSLGNSCMSAFDVVIIGNEGHGISPELSALCDMSVYIPISKNTESLNASVAAAIFMWEQSSKL